MRYGKVNEAIWTDDKFSQLSTVSKLFFIYLMSCSKCNSTGIFQTGLGVIEDEFGEDRQVIRSCISELEEIGLVRYECGWMWFNRFLKWNQPTSPNHARQCAAVLNDIVSKNAPAEAVCNFLGSAHPILSGLKQKSQNGTVRCYWDDFRSVLSQSVVDYLGGEDSFRECVKGGKCGIRSTGKALPKGSASTFSRSTDEVLPEYSASTGEALGNKDKTRQVQDNNKTRQDKTKFVLACDNSEASGMSLICSDGEPHAVGQALVRLVAEDHPDWDLHVLKVRLQALTALDETVRPDPDRLDEFFLAVSSTFDGDRVRKPEKRFSQEKHESSPPEGKGALDGPCERSGEESDAEEEDA